MPSYAVNRPQVVLESFAHEVVLIHTESCIYYSLNQVAADLWHWIEQGADAAEITRAAEARYAGDRVEIASSVAQFLADLEREQLVVPVASAAVKLPADAPGEPPAFVPPVVEKYEDMQDLLSLDPIHDVDDRGWPHGAPRTP